MIYHGRAATREAGIPRERCQPCGSGVYCRWVLPTDIRLVVMFTDLLQHSRMAFKMYLLLDFDVDDRHERWWLLCKVMWKQEKFVLGRVYPAGRCVPD